MGSFTISHHFADSKELSYKATILKNTISEIRGLSTDFTTFMKNEMETQNGDLVDAINKEMMDQHKNHTVILEYLEDTITSMTNNYTDIVNDMRTQDVTLYYTYHAYETEA